MSKVLVTESSLESIADAIRAKNGTENTYKPGQMAAAIEALPGPSTLVSKSITQNGSYDPEDDDADGYSAVTVNVPNSYAAGDEGKVVTNGALVAQTARSEEITVNGTYNTTENNSVTVNTAGGSTLITKTIEANGTYNAVDDSADGYSSVTVNVPPAKSLFNPYFKFSKQGGNDYSFTTRNGQQVVTKPGSYSGTYCFQVQVPASATTLYIDIELGAFSSQYSKTTAISRKSDNSVTESGARSGTLLCWIAQSNWTVAEINGQTGVTINSTQNDRLSRQTVQIDVSDINEAFYVEMNTQNVVLYLYEMWYT